MQSKSPSWLVLALIFAAAAGRAADAAPAPAAAPARTPVLFVCGDSTAAPSRAVTQGWGEMLGEFFDPAHLAVRNCALGGRSARTFISEGHWAAVRTQLRPGDVVLLQFGHNDSQSALSANRYDLPGIGDEVATVTDPATGTETQIHTFGHYLRQMIAEGRAAGATVIVLSPVPRCKWADGKIVRGEAGHGPWAAEVARAEGVPFVDVNALIADIYDPIGRARIKALYFPRDNTHTNPAGASLNAACVVEGLRRLNVPALTAGLSATAAAEAAALIAAVPKDAAAVRLAPDLRLAFPAPGAVDVCPDTPLRLVFPAAPILGTAGRIRIVDAGDGHVVETIDVHSRTAEKSIGGLPDYRYYPILVAGREATIFPKNGELAYGHTYDVMIDAGVFRDGDQPWSGIDQPSAWRFTTKAAPPAPGNRWLTVAADGTGDFCTVQGALDFIPDGNTAPTTIFLRKGTYTEMVFFTHKDAITLLGEDRRQCVIEYATNERFNPAGGNPYADSSDPSAASHHHGHIYHRGVFLAHRVNDLTIANLTIRNTTPQGGSQAEAIILNGTPTAHAILKDVDLYSYQDTLQINGQAYLRDCYIEGDVDFMWGTGPCYFEHCTCRALRSGAYFTQIRNPATNHGYVYAHCVFDGVQGINGNYLARIGTGRFPHSEVVLLDCTLGNAVGAVAWQLSGGREGNPRDPGQIHFWEFNSRDTAGEPVDMSFRMPGSRRLREPEDAAIIANYRDPVYVLGGKWDPRTARIFASQAAGTTALAAAGGPVIDSQPAGELALLGTNPRLVVAAHGGSRLTYQWSKDGHPLPGATSPALRIHGMTWQDAGVFTVTVANEAGAVTSEAARLTAVAPAASPAPRLPEIPDATFDVTTFGARADGAADNTAAFQKAIDAALGAGGGIVVVPAGTKPYLCGPIALGSHLDLQIDPGATVQLLPYSREATPPAGSYPRTEGRYTNFITARNAHDVAITGGGTIDGAGDAWWAAFRANRHMPRRPDLIRFNDCERVLVAGLKLTRSPMFHCAMTAVNNLTVFAVTVATPDGTPNTDGIDPSGSHQLVQNCAVSDGDDNVVLKAGSAFCTDITVADCAFGAGHGMSVGGQSNRGLDGMTVRFCTFDGTLTALRLKADATQGGNVQNISYSDLTMRHVGYPIVFYSYYRNIGNPGAASGNNEVTPAKAQAWNEAPPNSLAGKTLPAWKNITIANLTASDTKAYSIIWGLPLDGYLFANVRLRRVRVLGGLGLKLFDAADVQFDDGTDVGPVQTCNALAITRQPESQTASAGGSATFTVTAVGGAAGASLAYRWNFDGAPLTDGRGQDGSTISGAATATLHLGDI